MAGPATPALARVTTEAARRAARLLSLGLAFLLTLVLPLAAQPKFPALTGQIVDEAGLISAQDRAEILELLRGLEGKSTDQIAVYTTRSLQGYPIEDFGYQLGRAWGIGQQGKNNGILLIVAPNERKVRIEVGRGLEPIMTDLLSGLIVNNVILPAFRRNDFSGGIKAGVRDIRDALLGDAEEVKRRAAGGVKRSPGGNDYSWVIFVIFVGVMIAMMIAQQRAENEQLAKMTPEQRRRYLARRRSGGGVVVLPSGGGWSGGWSGGGGGGDSGGWSGGGGDFGGGGASGSW